LNPSQMQMNNVQLHTDILYLTHDYSTIFAGL